MFGQGALPGFVTIFLVLFFLVVGILAFLMPFFVFRLRNEMVRLNEVLIPFLRKQGDNHELLNKIAKATAAKD